MKFLLIIGLGGGVGSILRYLMQVGINKITPALAFPLGTFIVNITGCFLIGLFYGTAARHSWFSEEWRLMLITGLCGGYTTFSSFSYESMSLMAEGHFLYFGLYIGLSILFGLSATWLGYVVMR
ncbi:MAG TPA: fluoride efflux transporter CrcB [Edaphocola sp.]|nr:fluoride efflux transporter CrcB [Edaphocola sp.]